jgi:hypothetical protein
VYIKQTKKEQARLRERERERERVGQKKVKENKRGCGKVHRCTAVL